MALGERFPVLVYECAATARRWQTYAGRVVFVAALLITLIVVWALRTPAHRVLTLNALAAVGEMFFLAMTGTQLALVLLAAPAYTAGSICLDRARGTLTHMLVTDLSAAEIVLSKLAAHGLPVLCMLVAGLPVLVLATLLGGIEPEAVIGCFVVTASAGLAVCALAVTLSVWGRMPHEVLLATYVVVILWLLALPSYYLLQRGLSLGPSPAWLQVSNPFALCLASYIWMTSASAGDYIAFCAGCIACSALLLAVAVASLRRAAIGAASAAQRQCARRPRFFPLAPTLDFNPVLWREWHHRRPSRWLRVIWLTYALLSALATAFAMYAGSSGREMSAFVNAFQFSIGLLLVAVTAVAALFEERVNGSLALVLTTPLSTPSIVWGKWLASCRVLPLVALLPLVLAICEASRGQRNDAVAYVLLMFAQMMAYGAVTTSVALGLATWVPRFGIAVGVTVALYVIVAAVPVLFLLPGGAPDSMRGFANVSPWYAIGETTAQLDHTLHIDNLGWKAFWLLAEAAATLTALAATLRSFDRCMGRVPVTA
jgi:ABC-type transport system involved in multi-copper enzyme maturation permease subunit